MDLAGQEISLTYNERMGSGKLPTIDEMHRIHENAPEDTLLVGEGEQTALIWTKPIRLTHPIEGRQDTVDVDYYMVASEKVYGAIQVVAETHHPEEYDLPEYVRGREDLLKALQLAPTSEDTELGVRCSKVSEKDGGRWLVDVQLPATDGNGDGTVFSSYAEGLSGNFLVVQHNLGGVIHNKTRQT